MHREGPLVDAFGRIHSNLRISVTDRCNIRCLYCMPHEHVRFLPRAEILTFEEIERFVRAIVPLGINRLRLTGGEPLMRANLPVLIEKLAGIPGIVDLAMTTNGLLLADQAAALRQAGLRRLNISLDGLTPETFRRVARRNGLDKVLRGIAVAQELGFAQIRLNTVSLKGITEREIIPLAEFARNRHLELRFIEFMPLDADDRWQADSVLPGEQIRHCLESHFGPLIPAERTDPSQPAIDYEFADGGGRIGFINPVTQPFCADCNRLRITAEGQVRSCLFATQEWDARGLMRGRGSDQQLAALVRACVGAKKPGHGIDSPEFLRPPRAMYELGG